MTKLFALLFICLLSTRPILAITIRSEKDPGEVCNTDDPSRPDFDCKESSSNQQISMQCRTLNTKRPCLFSDATELPCFMDYECCSGYCDVTRQKLGGGICRQASKRPADGIRAKDHYPYKLFYTLKLPGMDGSYLETEWDASSLNILPVNRKFAFKEDCTSNTQCASGRCDNGECVALKACLPCTKRGEIPKPWMPCCGSLTVSKNHTKCDVVPKILGADMLDHIMFQKDATSELLSRRTTDPTPKIINWDTLEQKMDAKSCKVLGYRVKNSDGSTTEYTQAELDNEILLRKMFVMIFEFLHNFYLESNPNIPDDQRGMVQIKHTTNQNIIQRAGNYNIYVGKQKKTFRNTDKMHNKVHPHPRSMPYDIFGFLQKINTTTDILARGRFEIALKMAIDKIMTLESLQKQLDKEDDKQQAMMEFQKDNIQRGYDQAYLMAEGYANAFLSLTGYFMKINKDRRNFNDGETPLKGQFYKLLWTLPDYDDPASPGSTRKAAVSTHDGRFHRIYGTAEEHKEGFDNEEKDENSEKGRLGNHAIFWVRSEYRGQSCENYHNDSEEFREDHEESEDEEDQNDKYCVGNRLLTESLTNPGEFFEGGKAKERSWGRQEEEREDKDRSPSYINVYPALDVYSHEENAYYGYASKRGLKYNFYLFHGNYAKSSNPSIFSNQIEVSKKIIETLDPHAIFRYNNPEVNLTNKEISEQYGDLSGEKEKLLSNILNNLISPREKIALNDLYNKNHPALWNVFQLMTYNEIPVHPSMFGRHTTLLLATTLSDLFFIYEKKGQGYRERKDCYQKNVVDPYIRQTRRGNNGSGGDGHEGYAMNSTPSTQNNNPDETQKFTTIANTNTPKIEFPNTFAPTARFGMTGKFTSISAEGDSSLEEQTYQQKSVLIRGRVGQNNAFYKKLRKAKNEFEKNFSGTSIGKHHSSQNKAFNNILNGTMSSLKKSILNSSPNPLSPSSNVEAPMLSKKVEKEEKEEKEPSLTQKSSEEVIQETPDDDNYSSGGSIDRTTKKSRSFASSSKKKKSKQRAKAPISNRSNTSIFTLISWAYLNIFYNIE